MFSIAAKQEWNDPVLTRRSGWESYVRNLFAWNRGNDAAAVPLADFPDGKDSWKKYIDRLRGRNADCHEGKGLEPKTD